MKYINILLISALTVITFSCKEEAPKQETAEKVEVKQWQPEDTRSLTAAASKRGLLKKSEDATEGYVLFSPSVGVKTYIMNMEGNIVHQWDGEINTMHSYLQENGNLFRLERDIDFPTFAAGGQAGIIREYDWEGNKLWEFELADDDELLHHDFEVMPNGNILAISYHAKTPEQAIAAGRKPESLGKAGIWPDKIIEIKPNRPNGGEIVWEWHMWDHLVQDVDSTKANYGVIADNPRKIDINVHTEELRVMPKEQIEQMKQMGGATSNATFDNQNSDITHTNAIAYNETLDQIVISVPHYNEIFVIDHSTTTEEAKGSTGGKWGHGGDLLYRWGNPHNYGRGTKDDQMLFGQHDVKWIPEGYPGEGNIMVFNNDILHPGNKAPSVFAAVMAAQSPDPQIAIGDFGNYSAVYELSPPEDSDGSYALPENGVFGPEKPTWEYMAPDKYSFYSAFVSGAHRMKNGNTFITSGAKGRFFMVNPENEIVWDYLQPYYDQYALPDGSPPQPVGPFIFGQFRATHFDADFTAFDGKALEPISPQPEPFIFKMPPPPPTVEKDSMQ